ncbi:MAG: hemolysin family protein [Methanobrevibacter sp.]|jgi:putative hemolysin|nr:hemolysin family protein [Candidatus Methanovirga aequatorialis]
MFDNILNNPFLAIIILTILIVIIGLLSMAEFAIAASRKVNLERMKKEGVRHVQTVINLIQTPNEYLSSIQLGITLITILTGVAGEYAISEPIKTILGNIPFVDIISFILIIIITTYFTMLIGEVVPKRIALNNPEKIAVRIAKFTTILIRVSMPIVIILSKSTDFILKIIGFKKAERDLDTENEIKLLIKEGIKAGTIEKEEEDILKRVFRLDEEKVGMLMTPKKDIIWIDLEERHTELKKTIIESERSIFPVASGDIDNVLGVVQTKDILSSLLSEEELNIKSYIKKPLIVPENLSALSILKILKENKEYVHMALVVDEYGNVEGLITLNDILEGIVGDIPGIDEMDDPKVVKRGDGSWLIDGGFGIDNFKEFFKIEEDMPQEHEDGYTTLAGFILSYLERLPELGETFTWNDLKFEVVDMDGHIIDKILVNKQES